jgi:hypothetical protein
LPTNPGIGIDNDQNNQSIQLFIELIFTIFLRRAQFTNDATSSGRSVPAAFALIGEERSCIIPEIALISRKRPRAFFASKIYTDQYFHS